MSKPTTTCLVLFLVILASQGAYAAPTPFRIKLPGLGTYRSGSGWGDVTELPWKNAADLEAKAASKAASKEGKTSVGAVAGVTAATVVGGAGLVVPIVTSQDTGLGYDYAN